MDREEEKAIEEIVALKRLIDAMHLPIDKASIAKQTVGRPDLICKCSNGEYREVEVVRLVDGVLSSVIAAGDKAAPYTRTSDPTEVILNKKLSLKYQVSYPVDLLIYTDGRVITPDNTIIPTLEHLLKDKKHIFSNIWFMGEKSNVRLWPAS